MAKKISLNLRMVLLGIIGFVIMICWLLKQLLLLVSYPFVGLSLLLMSILMICLRPITKIMSLPQIQIQYMSFLTNLLIKCLKTKNKQDAKRIISFLDTIAREKLEPFINKSYQSLHQYVNSYEQKDGDV